MGEFLRDCAIGAGLVLIGVGFAYLVAAVIEAA